MAGHPDELGSREFFVPKHASRSTVIIHEVISMPRILATESFPLFIAYSDWSVAVPTT